MLDDGTNYIDGTLGTGFSLVFKLHGCVFEVHH